MSKVQLITRVAPVRADSDETATSRALLVSLAGLLISGLLLARPIARANEPGTSQCLFLPQTAIPMLAMGIRTLDDSPELRDRRLLDLWASPGTQEAASRPVDRVPLFRPFFVYEVRTVNGIDWHLLGDAYAGAALGWADGRQLRRLGGRYGYHFANPERVKPGVHLYGSRDAAYRALEAQSQVPPETPLEDVVVAERLEEDYWNPLAAEAIPPFIEMDAEEDLAGRFAAGLTDTTLTFPFPGENRLVCVGAVAGGPVDREALADKRRKLNERAGIAIVFVIDETLSMQQFFGGVADFIDKNLDLGENAVNVRVAVSWFSDIEKENDIPYQVQPLQPLNAPGMDPGTVKSQIVTQVKDHRERIIGGRGAGADELIYPGLIAAIEQAGFQPGENAMVFVIGDAADRSDAKELDRLQQRLEELIEKFALQVAFVQVGDVSQVGRGFTTQAETFRDQLPPALQESVIVQGPGDAPLQKRIADLQAQMDRRRNELLAEIREMETRNCYSEPGQAMERQMEAKGISREAFDSSHLQFFVPAWGWLYHPQQPEATPQLRELVFLGKPEFDGLIPALITAADGLQKDGRIDADAMRKVLGEVLERNSGHTGVKAALEAAWQGIPEEDRTIGRFFQDGLGLRVRNPLLFHRGTVSPTAGPTQLSIELLRTSRKQIGNARTEGLTWVDAWKVLP